MANDLTGLELDPIDDEIVGIASLIPDPKNARKHTEANMGVLAKSIEEVGVWRSVAIDENNVIYAGNATVEAAGQAGIENVRIIEADGNEIIAVRRRGLTEEQKRRYGMFDNRAAELAQWDIDRLEEFKNDDTDFADIFSDTELAKMLATNVDVNDQATAVDEAAPMQPLGTEVVTRDGDTWFLGDHILVCGDARDPLVADKLFDGQRNCVDMVFTDPPYNVSYVGKTGDALEIQNDKQSDEDFEQFLLDTWTIMENRMKPGCVFYVCHPAGPISEIFWRTLRSKDLPVRQQIVWVKNSLVMGHSDFHYRHEPLAYGWKAGAHYNCGDRTLTTVWEIDRPTASREHPTMKPTKLIVDALTYSSKPGDVVYDPFGGSGTTMLGCQLLGRRARLSELDPVYCDVIVRRWQELTGETPRRVGASTVAGSGGEE